MKRALSILATALAALCIWSCETPEPQPEPDPAPASLTLSADSFDVPVEGGQFSLNVTAPVRPAISGNPAWVSVVDGTFDKYRISYTLRVSANPDYTPRSATLTVTAGSLSKTVKLSQAAAEKPVDPEPEPPQTAIAEKLTNPKASAAAQKVYDYLRQQYGKLQLSGVQAGGTANNNDNVNAVFAMTGKHPAVAGYDYIFLQYSPTPASWSWKVDYGDISAAKEQWSKNGLVSFMWHWNVPTSKEAWDKGVNEANFDGYNFYCDKTGFDIRRALIAGNWEHDFLLKDIEKVAGYLKLLQQAGIPVLWRPLHEAAGNYTLYGPGGAWFWWGRGGADACKQLWKLLRDKLEGEYGLDNLIWVWTLDATPGAENQYADWYPGNDLVDIVGVDIYVENTSAQTRQYKAALALSGGKKLTTVSECGNIPDPEKSFAAGDSWSWFLAWSLDQKEYKYNTEAYWKQLMGSSRVLTRETMPSLK